MKKAQETTKEPVKVRDENLEKSNFYLKMAASIFCLMIILYLVITHIFVVLGILVSISALVLLNRAWVAKKFNVKVELKE